MKIKKVEIAAFRAFNELAIFDFMLPDETAADFISIYAPNGFGKTSFYDAVEWGITNSIDRFNRNYSENDKYSKVERKVNSKKLFLKNHQSANRDGYVKVLTDETSYNRAVPSTVYDFKNKGENLFFKDSILSQDTIDAFLNEENPEDRYHKFVDSFAELKGLDNAYNNIVKLISLNDDKLEEVTKELTQLRSKQLSLNFSGDEKVLKEINDCIRQLREHSEKIDTISKNNSESDLNILSTKVLGRISELEADNQRQSQRIENLNIAFRGKEDDNNFPGVISYFNLKGKKQELLSRLHKLNLAKDHYERRRNYVSQIENIESNMLIIRARIDEVRDIANLFSTYHDVGLKIAKREEDKELYQRNIRQLREEISTETETKNKLASEFSTQNSQLLAIKEKLNLFPSNEITLSQVSTSINELKNELLKLNKSINEAEEKKKELSGKVVILQNGRDQVRINIDLLLGNENFRDEQQKITEIIRAKSDLSGLSVQLTEVDKLIEKDTHFNADLAQLISKGLELISKDQIVNCPLCNYKYDSFADLSDKIRNNPYLNSNSQGLLNQKAELTTNIDLSRGVIREMEEAVVKALANKEGILTAEKTIIERTLNELKSQLEVANNNLKGMESDSAKLLSFFESKSPEEFRANIQLKEGQINEAIKSINERLEIVNEKISSAESQIKLINIQTDDTESQLKNLMADEAYLKVRTFFSSNVQIASTNKGLLNDINENTAAFNKCQNDIEEVKKRLAEIAKDLVNVTEAEDVIGTEISSINRTIELNESIIVSCEQLIAAEHSIYLSQLDLEQASGKFEEETSKAVKNRDRNSDLVGIYKRVSELKEETLKFLTANKTKTQIDVLNKEKSTMELVEKTLKEEKAGLIDFLRQKIKSFFYTDLINQIYFKIEPHPDYKRIEFECSFSTDKPRLEIWVIDDHNNKSIPTLYFSTAQVNILSLSVFLARALHANKNGQPINCIFIDDPIQSMDSINVLSFIDLFRSIVVNFGKQVIISTHEENFHNLLKKKIPKNYFQSKFIEFETYGKIKGETVTLN